MADAGGFIIVGRTPEEIVSDDMAAIKRRIPFITRKAARIAAHAIAAEAPVESGRLRRSVRAVQRRTVQGRFARGFNVIGGAQREGFDYLAVTRFGHRQKIITPKHARYLKVRVNGRMRRPIWRRAVKGYTPAGDWVARGQAVARAELEALHMEEASILARPKGA